MTLKKLKLIKNSNKWSVSKTSNISLRANWACNPDITTVDAIQLLAQENEYLRKDLSELKEIIKQLKEDVLALKATVKHAHYKNPPSKLANNIVETPKEKSKNSKPSSDRAEIFTNLTKKDLAPVIKIDTLKPNAIRNYYPNSTFNNLLEMATNSAATEVVLIPGIHEVNAGINMAKNLELALKNQNLAKKKLIMHPVINDRQIEILKPNVAYQNELIRKVCVGNNIEFIDSVKIANKHILANNETNFLDIPKATLQTHVSTSINRTTKRRN